jgi:hypothetical protein
VILQNALYSKFKTAFIVLQQQKKAIMFNKKGGTD